MGAKITIAMKESLLSIVGTIWSLENEIANVNSYLTIYL